MMGIQTWKVILAELLEDCMALDVAPDKVYHLLVSEIMRAWVDDRLTDDDMRGLTDYARAICSIARDGGMIP